MGHETNLLTLLAAGLVLGFVLGAVAHRLRLSPLVGYLVAGMLVGALVIRALSAVHRRFRFGYSVASSPGHDLGNRTTMCWIARRSFVLP